MDAARCGRAFFAAYVGASKLSSDAHGEWVRIFDRIGSGQGFRYLTDAMQVAGGILLLIPRTLTLGARMLACTMIGAMPCGGRDAACKLRAAGRVVQSRSGYTIVPCVPCGSGSAAAGHLGNGPWWRLLCVSFVPPLNRYLPPPNRQRRGLRCRSSLNQRWRPIRTDVIPKP